MKTKLIDLWRTSSLIQGTLALTVTAAIIYLAIQGREIPDLLTAIVMAIIGFYFGAKNRVNHLPKGD